MNSYTNSALTTARRCLTEYDLRYNQQLELDTDEEREALAVGTCWHHGHEMRQKGYSPWDAIRETAPNDIWAEKLTRLFAAHEWYWAEQPLEFLASEVRFNFKGKGGETYEGMIDGVVMSDGRVGLFEMKTTGDNLGAESMYWERLRMDTQVGTYATALTRDPELRKLVNAEPSFILYDVTRKPTINPKALAKKDQKALLEGVRDQGFGVYCDEQFTPDEVAAAVEEGRESIQMYGARLTQDIGERPDYYFARREVPRTAQDLATLESNTEQQVKLLEYAQANGLMHRNPNSCATFGLCEFFALCSNNVKPTPGTAPTGFRIREHRHPELANRPSAAAK